MTREPHQTISNMAMQHAALHGSHVALRECHVAISEQQQEFCFQTVQNTQTLILLNCLFLFFIHSKQELITPFLASIEFFFIFMKKIDQYRIIRLKKQIPKYI